jgi:hypothetical protein
MTLPGVQVAHILERNGVQRAQAPGLREPSRPTFHRIGAARSATQPASASSGDGTASPGHRQVPMRFASRPLSSDALMLALSDQSSGPHA